MLQHDVAIKLVANALKVNINSYLRLFCI